METDLIYRLQKRSGLTRKNIQCTLADKTRQSVDEGGSGHERRREGKHRWEEKRGKQARKGVRQRKYSRMEREGEYGADRTERTEQTQNN